MLSARLRDSVVVTLKTGESFSGILYSHDASALVLRNAHAIGAGERKTDLPLDGEVLLLWADVAWVQIP